MGAAAEVETLVDGVVIEFQTPSAGRWVLQLEIQVKAVWCPGDVSNPISGEVGAAASSSVYTFRWFPSPVSNPISGEVGAAA